MKIISIFRGQKPNPEPYLTPEQLIIMEVEEWKEQERIKQEKAQKDAAQGNFFLFRPIACTAVEHAHLLLDWAFKQSPDLPLSFMSEGQIRRVLSWERVIDSMEFYSL